MLLFESFNEIHEICKKYNIKNYTINKDGTIDVDGDVDLSFFGLTKLPLKFREVTGVFRCDINELTTLEGAPHSVGGNFFCDFNELVTLEGSPKSVGHSFWCNNNKLTTLEGAPQSIGENFRCDSNPLYPISELFPNSKTFYNLYIEWKFFAGGNKIWKHKLLEAMADIGEELPESIPGYKYI